MQMNASFCLNSKTLASGSSTIIYILLYDPLIKLKIKITCIFVRTIYLQSFEVKLNYNAPQRSFSSVYHNYYEGVAQNVAESGSCIRRGF